jgi:hypothetical protein
LKWCLKFGGQVKKRIKAFEPEKYGSPEWEKAAFAAFNPDLRGIVDAIGTKIRAHNGHIFIANLKEKAGVL